MISIKLKFRPSAIRGGKGTLFYQMIYKRTVRRIKSRYRIYNSEWDKETEQIIIPQLVSFRYKELSSIAMNVYWELQRFEKVVHELEQAGTSSLKIDEVVEKFVHNQELVESVFSFIHTQVQHKKQLGKIRSSETYQATLNSFMRFRRGVDLSFEMIDSDLMELYEADLRNRGLSRNTTSFYMRILRTNYRLAIEKGLTSDRRPFKHVYCGIDKTLKRSISLIDIKKIKDLNLSTSPVWDFARDMFLFSFCTRGMSFVDMAYLKKKDLQNGYLTYRRKKTGQLLTIEWTEQMQNILDKYEVNATQYLLPIILREDGNERRQYQNQMMKINRYLKRIATSINLSIPLSLYYSRHSWATIARGKDIPLSVISEALGHDSESTTQIYLDSIKSSEVDKANKEILKEL